MEYKKINGTALSRLGMGNMRLPILENNEIDYEKGQEIIDYCVSQGINYFDTAYIYHEGKSEVFLGKAMKKYPRESFYVADKYNILANPNYKEQFEDQLTRLEMEYIDFYLLHGISDHNVDDYLENGCIEYFLKEKEKGRIKYLGFSFHGQPKVLRKIVERHDWDFGQLQLNYYDWKYDTAKEEYDILTKKNIPVMVMEPVHGGMLASLTEEGNKILKKAEPDKSIASWAMRFVMDLPNVFVVLSGMSNMDQVKDNIHTFNENKTLSKKDMELIMKANALHYETVAVPCTSCRYCCPECPQQLDIPELLNAYNEYKLGGAWRLSRLNGFDEEKRPNACIGCGICTQHCPQNIDIPGCMQEMVEAAE